MREVVYHRRAVRYLRRMPVDRKEQVKAAITDLAELDEPATHPNVKAMSGDWSGCLRLRVGRYRAIFHLVAREEEDLLEVLQVGPAATCIDQPKRQETPLSLATKAAIAAAID